MNDTSRVEQVISQSEIQEAEAMLSPEQRVMSRVRASILAPLEGVDLPEDQVKIISDYAERAAEKARREFEQLQEESPANRIFQALEARIARLPEEDKRRELQERTLRGLREKVATWQIRIAEAQGLALAQGEKKTRTEVIETSIGVRRSSDIVGSGVDPEVLSIAGSTVGGKGEMEDMLRELGFFPEDTTFNSLFSKLPIKPRHKLTNAEIEQLKWQGKAQHVESMEGADVVVGLSSERLPGVSVVLERWKADDVAVFCFTTEAIAKSTTNIPAVVV